MFSIVRKRVFILLAACMSLMTLNAALAANSDTTSNGLPALTITGVAPAIGGMAGGNLVRISGTGLMPFFTVTIGGAEASITSISGDSTWVDVYTPPHAAGTADVTVTLGYNNNETVTAAHAFTYDNSAPAIAISSIAPSTGSFQGKTAVTLSVASYPQGGAEPIVTFGGLPAFLTSFGGSDGKITLVTPPHDAGAVDVSIDFGNGLKTTAVAGFTYDNSLSVVKIDSVTPSSGPAAGGTVVKLQGSDIWLLSEHPTATEQVASYPTITFDGTAGTLQDISGDGSYLTVVTPPHAAGAVDIVVAYPSGFSVLVKAGYTYVDSTPQQVSILSGPSASPNPALAGTPVTFFVAAQDGTDFAEDITYAWDLGDGVTTTTIDNVLINLPIGARMLAKIDTSNTNLTHVYAAAGTYTVTVTASDARGSASASVIVVVTATDSPTVPPIVTPTGPGTGTINPTAAMKIDKALSLPVHGGAKLSLSGVLSNVDAFKPKGAPVSVGVAGQTFSFTLGAGGAGSSNGSTIKLALHTSKGSFAGGSVPFKAALKSSTPITPGTMDVSIVLNGKTYAVSVKVVKQK